MKHSFSKLSSYLLALLPFLWNTILLNAQNATEPAMADVMRSNGKIYVVVAVLMVIFIGIVVYLFRIERKMDRMEKENDLL